MHKKKIIPIWLFLLLFFGIVFSYAGAETANSSAVGSVDIQAGSASSSSSVGQGITSACTCPSLYEPVCGSDGKTYSNKCVAECYGVQVKSTGGCGGTSCPSEDKLYEQIKKCKLERRDYSYYYDDQQCKQVKCGDFFCPDSWELEQKIQKCKDAGGNYSFFTFYNGNIECKDVVCIQGPISICPTQDSLESDIAVCKAQGMNYEYKKENGCLYVKCVPTLSTCNAENVEEQIAKCKGQGLEYTVYVGADGCKYAKCIYAEPEAIECKKTIELWQPPCAENALCSNATKKCVLIKCTDGFQYNNCKSEEVCPLVTCREFSDEKNCIVKKCSDGSESKTCPTQQVVECKVVKLDNGCEQKKCSDGYTAQSCPLQGISTTPVSPVECKTYTDEKGCTVKKCTDGYEVRACPTETDNIECKVYKDDKGCEVKECSNGYSVNSCAQVGCETVVDTATGCTIKKCSDGSISKACLQAPSVECKKYTDDKGCTIKKCTDGYEAKECPEANDTLAQIEARLKILEEGQQKQMGLIEMILSFFGIGQHKTQQ